MMSAHFTCACLAIDIGILPTLIYPVVCDSGLVLMVFTFVFNVFIILSFKQLF